MKQTQKYTVTLVESHNDNQGNPDVVSIDFNTLEAAKEYYNEEISESYNVQGGTCLLQLWRDGDNEECLKSGYKNSEIIPEHSVIVSYKHLNYMHYAYKVVEVRLSTFGERY